jgi:hypothetical protein
LGLGCSERNCQGKLIRGGRSAQLMKGNAMDKNTGELINQAGIKQLEKYALIIGDYDNDKDFKDDLLKEVSIWVDRKVTEFSELTQGEFTSTVLHELQTRKCEAQAPLQQKENKMAKQNTMTEETSQEAKTNVHQRMMEAMHKVSYLQKETKKGVPYSLVSHDEVTKAVRDVLIDVGVHYFPCKLEHIQNGNRTEAKITVKFVNVDDPTDYFEVPSLGYGVDQQDKGPGKAISYAVKYALLKAFALVTGDDPDYDTGEEYDYNSTSLKDEDTKVATITLDQQDHIKNLISDAKRDQGKFLIKCKVRSFSEITVEDYNKWKNLLEEELGVKK